MLKIAVISDTHLPRRGRGLPSRCLELMRSAELIVHAGDISTEAALTEIESLGPPVKAVHGNVDSDELRRRLPSERLIDVEDASIAVVHDGGPSRGRVERLRLRFAGAGAVVFGHSHLPLREVGEKGFQIFNPGSPTDRRRSPQHTMGLAVVKGSSITFELIALD